MSKRGQIDIWRQEFFGGMSMLQIKNLTITHLKDHRVLLKDFHLILNSGDKAAVIGEEGNGKSTLLKLIYNEALVADYIEYTGEIIKNRLQLGYLAQELLPEEKQQSVYEFMCQMPLFYEVTPKELGETARHLQLPAELFYAEQEMGKLSGGEKIKVQLARLMLQRPEVLLLDEPSNDLDLATVRWLEGFIQSCRVPVLYISHDEVLLEHTANKIVHLEQIKRKTEPRATVSKTDYCGYAENRMRNLAKQEQIARKERSDYQKQQEKFRQLLQKVEHQQKAISRQDPKGGALLKKHMHRIKAYEGRFEREAEHLTELPETEDAIFIKFGEKAEMPAGKMVLSYSLPKLCAGERVLAENIELQLRGAEKVCIIGKNGCGKTTLLQKIAEVLLERKDLKAAYMPQNYEELLLMEQTPVEFLAVNGDKEEYSRIRTYLGSMKYTADEMEHKTADLSGGQKAKLLLLKMSMEGSNVLILDEPTRNFSPMSGPVIRKLLKNFGGAILSVSHDRKYLEEVAETVYELTPEGLVKREKIHSTDACV